MKMIIGAFVVAFIWLTTHQLMAQKVGLLMDSYVIDRWYTDQKYLIEKIKDLGGECIVEVPYGNPDEQLKLGKKLIEQKVDVLIVVPTDGKKAADIVTIAKEAGIPVIAYDRLILSNDLTFYVSYNNELVGKLQASYMMEKKPEGNYLLINGPTSDNNAILFRQGQLNTLKPAVDKKKIKIIDDIVLNDWSEIEALMKMDEFLSANTQTPDVILAANDAIATGVLQALPSDLAGKVLVTGQDADLLAIKHIAEGRQAMTIYKPIKPLAYVAAEVAMALAKGVKIEAPTTTLKSGDIQTEAVLLEPLVVDQTNYKETVIKDGHVVLEEVSRD